MPECNADATWYGSLTEGDGEVSLGDDLWSGRYGTPDMTDATNPEELLAAGQASCFAMTAAYVLDQSGYDVEHVAADATVRLEQTEQGFEIPSVTVGVNGEVPDATAEEFEAAISQAEEACPVSNALSGTAIEVSATLS